MTLHPIEEPDGGRGCVMQGEGYECLFGGSGSAPSRLAGWLPSPDTALLHHCQGYSRQIYQIYRWESKGIFLLSLQFHSFIVIFFTLSTCVNIG